MRKSLLYLFILIAWNCFGQSTKSDVQIINGRDFFSDTTKTKQDQTKFKDGDGKSYTIYQIETGDSWNSIAKKFGVTYSELRLANKSSDKLIPGKNINIPTDKLKVNDPYFQKKELHSDGENSKKENKYHVVASGQTLFGISNKYNVSVDQIKEWNNLSSNSISVGQKLIVGKTSVEKVVTKEKTVEEKTPEKKEIILAPVKKTMSEPVPVREPVKEEKKVLNNSEKNSPASNDSDEKIIFANGRHEVNENGKALCMEEDETNMDKYYALHRTAPVGTIIRIENKANSKKIYVKVVGELPNSFENEDAIIKISKASAEKLGVNAKSFQATLLYGVN